MNKRQMHKIFANANNLIFNNELPKTVLALSKREGIGKHEMLGCCQVAIYKNRKVTGAKISLYPASFESVGMDNLEDETRILIHEMLHLYIAVKAGHKLYKIQNMFSEHDPKIAKPFERLAFEAKLISDPELYWC